MRIVFLGTGEFAVAALDRLTGDPGRIEVAGVVTAPDRERGRGRKVLPGPVAVAAERGAIPCLRVADVNRPEALAWIRALRPEAVAVVDFGQKLGRELLDLPPLGCVNLHPSLLPRHRGASPVQYAILCGDRVTGISILEMGDRMDAGPVLAKIAVPVCDGETAGELAERLRPLGALLLARTLEGLAEGILSPEVQDESRATLAPKITKEERAIRWDRPAVEIVRRIHALSPKPGATAHLVRAEVAGGALRLVLLRAAAAGDAGSGEPGVVTGVAREGVIVAASPGTVTLVAVKPAGGREMSGAEFVRGYRPRPGERFVPSEVGP